MKIIVIEATKEELSANKRFADNLADVLDDIVNVIIKPSKRVNYSSSFEKEEDDQNGCI